MENLNERLVVRNFGPISNLDIIIRPLTLFIGTQGSGKSTVSKLLTICREQRWWWNRPNQRPDFHKRLRDFGIGDYVQEDSYIEYSMTDDVTYHPNKVTYEHGTIAVTTDGDRESEVRHLLFIPAERNLVGNMSEAIASMWSAQIPISTLLLEYMSQFERASKELPVYEIPFFGVNYVKKDNRNMIELRGKNKMLPLSASSSGLQSAIPMLVIMDYALVSLKYKAFVIEEPEQNLFPENQREIMHFIASRINGEGGRQAIITTHSPYMLSCLNVLMMASKLSAEESIKDAVEQIVPSASMVNPKKVAVYSLNPAAKDGEPYCKSLISEKTGLVSVNELDSASLLIGEDFDKLARLYSKVIKNGK